VENPLLKIAVITLLLPLLGALIAGFFGKIIGRRATHCVTVSLVGASFFLACYLFYKIVLLNQPGLEGVLYTWVSSGVFQFDIAILLDHLSVTMVCVVAFVSFMVHIYTIGYMADDPGYQRFFSYVSLFTFAMLSLVLANNFLLMFFGWEGVGLVSYLLIGFWFKRETAVFGSLKAFIANRVGDVGFVLAIAAVLMMFGSLNYHTVFAHVPAMLDKTIKIFPGVHTSAITVICVLLFVGAMAKSAQVPLHVWLPESMEGPTPISALIHAATMVTAGIYMVARMSPMFEYSPTALSLVLVIGGTTCFFMGILAVFHHDIKRVIAYSTISQLGYMAVALGASAYDAAIFHLVTHAFFKALLFLAAGSVIIALHHEQDMRKMGGLGKYMPITCLTFWIGAVALAAIPPFSGFYSKDVIIEAAKLSTLPGAKYAYFCVLIGAFLTPLYIFRAGFMTFHGKERMDAETKAHVKESPWVVLLPLIALAIPSLVIGGILVGPMLFAQPHLLGDSIFVLPEHNVLLTLGQHFEGAMHMALEAGTTLTFWLVIIGIFTAYYFTISAPHLGETLKKKFSLLYAVIVNKYGFDDFNQIVFVRGTRKVGDFFYQVSDLIMIDGIFVNGSGRLIRWFSQVARKVQTGYLYHYAFAMIIGLAVILTWAVLGL
jgi:NADH-quinone oxidoreductase subunit L